MNLLDRIMSKVDRTSTCWLWIACVDQNGYARIGLDGRKRLAHRVLYELVRGPIPIGLDLDHLCRNPRCVRPRHMEPVTHAENMRRTHKVACPGGHLYDLTNTYINPKGDRFCRVCNRDKQRLRRERELAA